MSLKGTSVMTESLHGNEEPGVLCRDVGRSRSGQERSSGGGWKDDGVPALIGVSTEKLGQAGKQNWIVWTIPVGMEMWGLALGV